MNAQGSERGVYIDYGGGSSLSFVPEKFEGHRVTMDRVADTLSRFMDRPVVNMTGLKGGNTISRWHFRAKTIC